MSLLTGLFYKPQEHALRHGIWFAGNGIAGQSKPNPRMAFTYFIPALFGGLLAYAISHIRGSIASWRWLYIIFGIVTFVWGIVLFAFLPDSPKTARFLSPKDQDFANRRPQQNTHSFKTTVWKKDQFLEALRDPKTWFLFIYTVCSTIPNGGITNVSLTSLLIHPPPH